MAFSLKPQTKAASAANDSLLAWLGPAWLNSYFFLIIQNKYGVSMEFAA